MNAVVIPTRATAAWRDAIGFVWRAWTASTRRQWGWVAVLALLLCLVTLPARLEMAQRIGWHPLPAVTEMLLPAVGTVLMFLGWLLADAGADSWRDRRTRLLYAMFGFGAIATVAVVALWHLSGAAEIWAQHGADNGKPPKSLPLMLLADYVNTLAVGGMVYAVVEMFLQRQRTQLAFESTLRQQVGLQRQLLESRLAAMQAQVEPRFLFDTLVDIESLYRRDPAQAAAHLDHLIAFLRAALPRLRDSGSTVEAEFELVAAYLRVVTASHGGRPRLAIDIADGCRRARFYPMLLLPLVQRAVRQPDGELPERIEIAARGSERQIVVTLRVARAGGCADDPELARVRERLAGLYGAAASLDCEETADATVITLRIAADGAAR